MPRLTYTREEILAQHEYAKPHEVAGYRLHGGFDAAGRYVPPRTLHRWPAVRAWRARLEDGGWPLLDASARVLQAPPLPCFEQQRLLLHHGLGQTLWNSLTITGVIEARGRFLIDLPAPDFQRIVEDDLAQTATGHLNLGLLTAHGMDEGGDPATRLGAHDAMWFAVRDLVFGRNAYPFPEVPASIARSDGKRLAPRIPLACEQMLSLLMNVLLIEVRAEVAFDLVVRVLGDPEMFRDRRAEAEIGVEMVERIRVDEQIHVAYLQTALSEMRSFTWRTTDGGRMTGADLIDPMWASLVHWHAVENPRLAREQLRGVLRERISRHTDGERLWHEFIALEAPVPVAA